MDGAACPDLSARSMVTVTVLVAASVDSTSPGEDAAEKYTSGAILLSASTIVAVMVFWSEETVPSASVAATPSGSVMVRVIVNVSEGSSWLSSSG